MVIITGYYYGCGQSCLDTNSQIVPGKSIINNLQEHWSKSFALMKFCISNLKVLEYGKEIGDGPSTQRSLVIFCPSEGRKIHLYRQSKRPGSRAKTLQTHRIDEIYISCWSPQNWHTCICMRENFVTLSTLLYKGIIHIH